MQHKTGCVYVLPLLALALIQFNHTLRRRRKEEKEKEEGEGESVWFQEASMLCIAEAFLMCPASLPFWWLHFGNVLPPQSLIYGRASCTDSDWHWLQKPVS